MVRDEIGPFHVDLMACTASVLRSPLTGEEQPFLSRLWRFGGDQRVGARRSIVPGTTVPAFGLCLPPPIMTGHIVQHLTEWQARAVVLSPGLEV